MFCIDQIKSPTGQVVLTLAAMLFAGFLATRVTKKLHLPNVTGYILSGILIGPYALGLVSKASLASMDFVTDVALAFIAFGVGRYFKLADLKQSGLRVIVITLTEALAAFAVVSLTMMLVFHLSPAFSLLLGAISSATAPASTIMTIRQYKAKGPFVDLIFQVVALDDAVALIAFSVSATVLSMGGAERDVLTLLLPVVWNLLAVAMGALAGVLLHKMVDNGRSADHRLVLIVATLLLFTGLCSIAEISPLLSCMAIGAAYINASGRERTFEQVENATPPVILLFFVLSGARLEVPMLATAGVIGVVYFFVRILGKYAGAWVGCAVTHAPPLTTRYLGLALVPQAGVSIGLAALAERIIPGPTGVMISTIILSSGVLYEMIGPACAKASLYLSHTLTRQQRPQGKMAHQ